MTSAAVLGLVGVLLGSAMTAIFSLIRENIITRREREAGERLHQAELANVKNTFQREVVLATQDAAVDLTHVTSAITTELGRIGKSIMSGGRLR